MLLLLVLLLSHEASLASDKKNQVEELMIWKISDELKLSTKEEQKFAQIFKKLNLRKNELNRSLQELIVINGSSSEKDTIQTLQRYRKKLVEYNKLSEVEFDELKGFFGSTKMLKYLQIKQDLNNRIKQMLSQGESEAKAKATLPQPKIIEEK